MGEFIKNTPGGISAMVSGCVTIFVLVIQSIFLFSKNRREEKSEFESSLKEKLEKVNSPLFMYTNKAKYEKYLLSDEIIKVINQYAHLLSMELLKDIRNLYETETILIKSGTCTDIQEKEHENLKKKVLLTIDSEFLKLQSIKNKSFSNYSKQFSQKWYIKLGSSFSFGCVIVTIAFYLLLLFSYVFSYLYNNNKNQIIKNPTANFGLYVLAAIILITTLIYIPYLFILFSTKVIDPCFKRRKIYSDYYLVPESAVYKCRACGKEHNFIKYDSFTPCDNHKSFLSKLRYFSYSHAWIFDRDLTDLTISEV